MLPSLNVILTILAMGCATYATRLCGFLLFRKIRPSPRLMSLLDTAPGCVLIAVIAPYFVADNPLDLLALGITLLAASRFSMIITVLIGICSAALLRYLSLFYL